MCVTIVISLFYSGIVFAATCGCMHIAKPHKFCSACMCTNFLCESLYVGLGLLIGLNCCVLPMNEKIWYSNSFCHNFFTIVT